jgi:hypothetical protein
MEEPDVVDYLTAMHQDVQQLLEQAETMNTKVAAHEAVPKLLLLLQAHQAQIHPVIAEWIQHGREIVDHYVHTHQVLEKTIADLDNCDAGMPAFVSQLRCLTKAFEEYRQGSVTALYNSGSSGLMCCISTCILLAQRHCYRAYTIAGARSLLPAISVIPGCRLLLAPETRA